MKDPRRMWINPEPCTVDCDVIEQFLRHVGWPNAAELVRRFGDQQGRYGREIIRWEQAYRDVKRRLDVYEPPEKYEPADPRSEWD